MKVYDADKIPEVFLQEREQELGEILPEQLTLKISKQLAVVLRCSAQQNDRSIEWYARRVLELWAEEEIDVVRKMQEFCAERGMTLEEFGAPSKKSTVRAKRRSEHEIRNDLADQLRNLGFIVEREVNTGAGNADIVLRRAAGDPPLAVIEVKVEIATWRECHQATGQATAYAKALKCKQWFVTAPSIDNRLLKDRVFILEGAAAAIHTALCGGDAA